MVRGKIKRTWENIFQGRVNICPRKPYQQVYTNRSVNEIGGNGPFFKNPEENGDCNIAEEKCTKNIFYKMGGGGVKKITGPVAGKGWYRQKRGNYQRALIFNKRINRE